jgi:hypothetical protein
MAVADDSAGRGNMEARIADGVARPMRTALLVDFDNIYISLQNRDSRAATRFATDPAGWTTALLQGHLSDTPGTPAPQRRLLLARVYGNPVMRNNDRSGFAFVRNHFMHAGYEVIDCPPLTNQLKNGSDIRMVLDMCDLIDHQPSIDEFIIMSGDSDFVPILLRLRKHDRRTMIYTSPLTARSYTAIADRLVSEDALSVFLTRTGEPAGEDATAHADTASALDPVEAARREIIDEVTRLVETTDKPMPMEQLAASVRNALGVKRTVDTRWGGYGQFSLLLAQALSREFIVSEKPPFMVWHRRLEQAATAEPGADAAATAVPAPTGAQKLDSARKSPVTLVIENILNITRIPALSARYYQRLFELIAAELAENGFVFSRTAGNAAERGRRMQLPVDPLHVQAILHRIRRHGHWFSNDDSPRKLARAFRDSVLAECLAAGLTLTGSQLDMLDAWFIPPTSDGDELQEGSTAPRTAAPADADRDVEERAVAATS